MSSISKQSHSRGGRRRKRRGGAVTSSSPSRLQGWKDGIPNSLRTHLKFSVSTNVATSGTLATNLISINNLFDPGVSISSLQPVYFDQLALMYNRYRVYGCRIRVVGNFQEAASGVGTVQIGSRLCVAPINGTGLPTTIEDAIAQSGAKWTEATSTKPAIINHSVTVAGLTGSRDIVGSDRFQAVVSAAPSETLNWAVSYINTLAQSNVDWHVEFGLEYDVEFFDRINLDRSSLSAQLLHQAAVERGRELQAAELKRVRKALGLVDENLTPLLAQESKELKDDPEKVSQQLPVRVLAPADAASKTTVNVEPFTPGRSGGLRSGLSDPRESKFVLLKSPK